MIIKEDESQLWAIFNVLDNYFYTWKARGWRKHSPSLMLYEYFHQSEKPRKEKIKMGSLPDSPAQMADGIQWNPILFSQDISLF